MRDTKTRGRTLESVVQQYMTTVRPMHEEFVRAVETLCGPDHPRGWREPGRPRRHHLQSGAPPFMILAALLSRSNHRACPRMENHARRLQDDLAGRGRKDLSRGGELERSSCRCSTSSRPRTTTQLQETPPADATQPQGHDLRHPDAEFFLKMAQEYGGRDDVISFRSIQNVVSERPDADMDAPDEQRCMRRHEGKRFPRPPARLADLCRPLPRSLPRLRAELLRGQAA